MSASLVILIIAIVIVGWAVLGYNGLVTLRNQVQNSWRQIDVQLRRRHDLIPNLVEAVKGYMQFERDTLTQVVEARAKAISAPDQASRMAAENQITGGLGRLLAVMENYPQIKSNENFLRLQDELAGTENRIAVDRRDYNEAVRSYNTELKTFPGILWAKTLYSSDQPMQLFAATSAAQAAPKVSFAPPPGQ